MTASPSADASPAAAAPAPPAPHPAHDPSALAAPEGGAPGADAVAAAPSEDAAWAAVVARWDDEARHRAYLARFEDLDGLAAAGARYRGVLLARPGDAVAARFRDQVVRRAMAQGLAALPRTDPASPRARLAIRVAAGSVLAALFLATLVMLARLVPLLGSGGAGP
jgi:hypothetical protein